MKLRQIALAFAAMAAGSAHALPPMTPAQEAVLDDAQANGRVIFISGASAVQKGFTAIIAQTFSSISAYYSVQGGADGPAVDKADFVAVSGTFAAGTGNFAGKNGIIIYRVKGGSVFGVDPVAKAEAIESMLVTKASCGTTGNGSTSTPYACGTTNLVPDAGVSDIAPALFKAPLNTEGEVATPSLSAADLAKLVPTPLYGLAFGVPVTNTVSASLNLNRAAISAILSGGVTTWDKVGDPAGGQIVICRRVPGSGSQAVMNLWSGNFPCGPANVPADRDTVDGDDLGPWDSAARKFTVPTGTGIQVVENSTSGQVRSCLDKAVTGGSYTTSDRDGNPVTVEFVGAGHKAIGVLSMDSLDKSKTSANWQFRSLDGAGKIVQDVAGAAPTTTGDGKFPTFAEYETGDWDLQGWISFNLPKRTVGDKKAVLDKFALEAKKPTVLQGISSLKYVAAGIPTSTVSGSFALDAAYLSGNQCAPYNRIKND